MLSISGTPTTNSSAEFSFSNSGSRANPRIAFFLGNNEANQRVLEILPTRGYDPARMLYEGRFVILRPEFSGSQTFAKIDAGFGCNCDADLEPTLSLFAVALCGTARTTRQTTKA